MGLSLYLSLDLPLGGTSGLRPEAPALAGKALFERLPTLEMLAVTVHGPAQSVLETNSGLPAEFALNLGVVELPRDPTGLASIISGNRWSQGWLRGGSRGIPLLDGG